MFGSRPALPSRRFMSKEDAIEVTGTVLEKFPSGLFSVQLEHERIVLAHLAGRLRRNRIRVLAGRNVPKEVAPYDLPQRRVSYRRHANLTPGRRRLAPLCRGHL